MKQQWRHELRKSFITYVLGHFFSGEFSWLTANALGPLRLYRKHNFLAECFILFSKRLALVLVVLDESSKYSAHEVYNRTYIPVSDPLRIIDFTEKY